MRPIANLLTLAVMCCTTAALAQQTDINSQIHSLEAAVQSGTATTGQQLDLARLYVQENRFYEAGKAANTVLSREPDNADAKAISDQASRRLHEVQDRAVADAEGNANRAGATDQDRLTLANAYFDAGSYGAAATTYARLPASLRDRDTRLRYARALAWSNRFDDAEQQYSDLLKEQSTSDLQLEYGRLLSWMGAQNLSITTLTRAYETNPSEDAVVALANARAWNGDREGALRLLDDYVNGHPMATKAAQLSSDLKASPDLRIERAGKLIETQPYNLALRVERARLYADAGRDGEALTDIAFVRDHSRQKLPVLDEIENRVREHRKAERAKLEQKRQALGAQSSMASSSANPDEVLALAKAYSAIEDYDHAVPLYQRYLALRPDDTIARVQYARVLSWDQQWRASERQYQILLERDPDRSDLRYEYAQVLSYDAQFVPALHVFRSLTDLSGNPRSRLYTDVPPKAYYNIGQIHRWYGWNDAAAAAQTSALALDPGYAPARAELDLDRHVRPTSTADARFSYSTDSNDFTLKRIDLTAERWTSTRTAFDLGVGRHEFEHLGTSVFANQIHAGGAYRSSDRLTFRGNVGLNLYDHGLGTRPFLGFGATWQTSLQSRAALDVNHYDLVYDVFTLQSLTIPGGSSPALTFRRPLTINDVRGHYDYATGGHWAFLGDASYGFISDNNHRKGAHGLLSFQVLNAPFVALKLDGRTLSYDFRSSRYWSPNDYKSLAGVVQVGQNLRNGFHWDVEVKAGRASEGSFHSDLRAHEGNVIVPLNDAFDLIGNYGYGKSGRLGDFLSSNANEAVNYWQRHWLVGVRLKQLYSRGDRRGSNAYYFDDHGITGSPIIPPETH